MKTVRTLAVFLLFCWFAYFYIAAFWLIDLCLFVKVHLYCGTKWPGDIYVWPLVLPILGEMSDEKADVL